MKETFIRDFLKKHPRLYCFLLVNIKKLRKAEECKKIIGMDKNPFMVEYHVYGKKNPDIAIYNIYLENNYSAMGLCSLIRTTLLHLGYADFMGFEPVVRWEKTLYSDNTNENTFNYFFKAVGDKYIANIYESKLVVNSKVSDRFFMGQDPYKTYIPTKDEMELLCKSAKKYLDLNESIKDSIIGQAKKLLQCKKVLGIHARGTDYKKNFSRHPILIPVSIYISAALELCNEYGYDYVFLATDEEQYIDEFKKTFNDKLLYYKECYRSRDGEAVHYGKNRGDGISGHKLGEEMLKDLFTLAMCDSYVGGLSNVTFMAIVINRSFYNTYREVKLLDHGINNNLKQSIRYIKRSDMSV